MNKAQDIQKAELERKKMDLWKVYNPTNQDMIVVLNKKVNPEEWKIPAKSEEIVHWYVAEMYVSKMIDRIMYSKSDKAVIEENERRMAKGFAKMDVHTEQARFESGNLKRFMTKREQLEKILLRGLYKEYGLVSDRPVGGETQKIDSRSLRVDSEIDSTLGLAPSSVPAETRTAQNEPPESQASEEKSTYDKRLEALAKARAAKKEKNAKD